MKIDSEPYFEPVVGPFCKKNCTFCCEGGYGKRIIMEFDKFKETIDNNSFKKVFLSGGEPTLNKDLVKYIQYCSKNNIYVGLVTARDKMYDNNRIKDYEDAGLNEIMFSLEGPERIHDTLVNEKGAYKAIINALHYIGSNNIDIKASIGTNINKMSAKYLGPFVSQILKNFSFIYSYRMQFLRMEGNALTVGKGLFDSFTTLIRPFLKHLEKVGPMKQLTFVEVPHCILPKRAHFLVGVNLSIHRDFGMESEFHSGKKNEIDTLNDKKSELKTIKLSTGKIFLQKCMKCMYRKSCSGFMPEYIKVFGDDEINPVI